MYDAVKACMWTCAATYCKSMYHAVQRSTQPRAFSFFFFFLPPSGSGFLPCW